MTVTPYINNKPHKNGLFLIMIRVTQARKHKYVSSEIYIKENQWNKSAKWGQWIRTTHSDAQKLNRRLEERLGKVRDHFENTGVINPKAAIKGDSFFEYAKDFMEKYNHASTRGTYEIYSKVLNKLKKYAGDQLTFQDINVKFLRNYVNHLKKPTKKKPGNSINTIGVDLKKIKAIFNQAVIEEVVEYKNNPFLKIKIESTPTHKEKLSNEDLEVIKNMDLDGWLAQARNIFLFCMYCGGMRIGSALSLKSKQISNGILSYQMSKGGKPRTVVLTPEALGIVSKYEGGVYVFPYLEGAKDLFRKIKSSTVVINKALKKIAEYAGIEKKITTHVQRHTLTRLAIDAGIDMRELQGVLGHSTISMTEHYAGEISDKTSNDALSKIFKKS